MSMDNQRKSKMMLWKNKKFAKPWEACAMCADWLSPILNLHVQSPGSHEQNLFHRN